MCGASWGSAGRQAGVQRGPVRAVPGRAGGDRRGTRPASTATRRLGDELRERLAERHGVPAERVALGNGADALVGTCSTGVPRPRRRGRAVLAVLRQSYRLAAVQDGRERRWRCRCRGSQLRPGRAGRADRPADAASPTSATPTTRPAAWSAASSWRRSGRPCPSGAGGRRRGLSRVRRRSRATRTRSPSTAGGRTCACCAPSRRSTAWPACGSATRWPPPAVIDAIGRVRQGVRHQRARAHRGACQPGRRRPS